MIGRPSDAFGIPVTIPYIGAFHSIARLGVGATGRNLEFRQRPGVRRLLLDASNQRLNFPQGRGSLGKTCCFRPAA